MRTVNWKMPFLGRLSLVGLLAAALLSTAAGCSNEAETKPDAKQVVTDAQYALLDQMNKHAENAYRSVKDGDAQAAQTHMVQLSAAATKLSYDGLTTIEGIGALSETVSAALQTLNHVQPDERKALLEVIKVRLAVDALCQPKRPMWLDFEKPLAENVSELEAAVIKRDKNGASAALNEWKARVALIRPAVTITKGPSQAAVLDSMSSFFENGIGTRNWKAIQDGLPNLSKALDELFRSADEQRETIAPIAPTAEPPHPILWTFTLGAVILGVLAYVAWRRYQAEAAYVRVKSEKDIDGIL
ncbi:sporulation protein YpjB [Paenibacillus thermotolerans]|uniref:sporulation protein YpjB n=1 Tax=Paenibacillus thermotolerans TaxID=3027807 RepID=UPI002368E577|nr:MULTISPECIES: sporulation protein YpjB [unclassified Paenibacillus]